MIVDAKQMETKDKIKRKRKKKNFFKSKRVITKNSNWKHQQDVSYIWLTFHIDQECMHDCPPQEQDLKKLQAVANLCLLRFSEGFPTLNWSLVPGKLWLYEVEQCLFIFFSCIHRTDHYFSNVKLSLCDLVIWLNTSSSLQIA